MKRYQRSPQASIGFRICFSVWTCVSFREQLSHLSSISKRLVYLNTSFESWTLMDFVRKSWPRPRRGTRIDWALRSVVDFVNFRILSMFFVIWKIHEDSDMQWYANISLAVLVNKHFIGRVLRSAETLVQNPKVLFIAGTDVVSDGVSSSDGIFQ